MVSLGLRGGKIPARYATSSLNTADIHLAPYSVAQCYVREEGRVPRSASFARESTLDSRGCARCLVLCIKLSSCGGYSAAMGNGSPKHAFCPCRVPKNVYIEGGQQSEVRNMPCTAVPPN